MVAAAQALGGKAGMSGVPSRLGASEPLWFGQADTDVLEQTPVDFTGRARREAYPGTGTPTGVDDTGTNSFTLCGTSTATPVDSGVVDMGAYERQP